MKFNDIFSNKKPIIACIHLQALPGSPNYDGDINAIYDQAIAEAEIFQKNGIDGLIVENFRDKPFFPDRVPAETVAAIAGITREVMRNFTGPVGINVLRNDAESAMAIASAVGADFIRVNVHMNAIVSEQGIIQGNSHKTLRLKSALKSKALIFADVGVKHGSALVSRGLAIETIDLEKRGLVDAIIVSGELTGSETSASDVDIVKKNTNLPVIIGSGATPENIHKIYNKIDGMIVGTYFKKDGIGNNFVDSERVQKFKEHYLKEKL